MSRDPALVAGWVLLTGAMSGWGVFLRSAGKTADSWATGQPRRCLSLEKPEKSIVTNQKV